MDDPPRPSSSAGDSSSESTSSSDTIAGPSTAAPVAQADTTPVATPEPATHEELATTPTPQPSQLSRTPPASKPVPSYAAIAAKSPQPPAHTQTPPPRPRTHSSTTAASSSFSSPARRDLSASDAILHEEEPSAYGTAGEEMHDEEEDRFFTPMQGGASGARRPSASATGARTRPPSGAVPSTSNAARRSISVNTSVSNASSVPATAPPPRQSLYHPQSSARLSVVPSVPTSASHSRSRQPASGSANPRRSVSRTGQHSAASSSRGGSSGSDADSDDGERRRRTRRGVQSAAGSDDDEVVTRDRGEELVRKRWKERKEARKVALAQRMKEDSQRRISAYTNMSSQAGDVSDSLGLGYPSNPNTPGPHGREMSLARSEAFSDLAAPRSPAFPSAAPPWSPLGLPPHHQHHHAYPHIPRPSLGQRGTSFVSSASASSQAGAGSDTEGPARSIVEADEEEGVDGDEPRMEDWRDGGADGEHDAGNDTDDEGEVEYTLKDRQDAINVEHPFGLPIWKPALYKKSRSIARHADAALHAAPSSTALHHLLPSNVIWTLSFGVWLFILCGVVSAILFITPFGGAKYGRVVWELGTYLFWPFGKYVEGWVEELDDGIKSDDAAPDGGQGVRSGDISDEEDNAERFGRRGRSGTIGQGGTISSTVSSPRRPPIRAATFDVLPDEPVRRSDRTVRPKPSESSLRVPDEHSSLLDRTPQQNRIYGSLGHGHHDRSDKAHRSSSEETITGDTVPRIRSVAPHDFSKDGDSAHGFRLRALGRIMYWVGFYLVIAPVLALVALACWGGVFSIPMAKLLWVLLRHLNNEPLSLYFRSPPDYQPVVQDLATDVEAPDVHADDPTHQQQDATSVVYPLRAGQPAPPQPRQSLVADRRKGRLRGPHPTVLLCTYRAAGLEYYKYTVDGVNVWFVNLLALVFLAIVDFFLVAPYVERHYPTGGGGVLRLISSQAFVFVSALLSVIPLSYFIGMAVASISAQSSIGVGAVINASFGSVIEIVLYSIALTQAKGELVEGSIVGSILAGVLLMPGMSMVGGAAKRKEQRFNARSAGVTSTMLIMAVIGTLTPTLFYEIYGSFQLTCTDCDPLSRKAGAASCKTCYYEHVSPADDPFYRTTVVQLSYYCAIILVLSYLIGLWFSLKTHASQIWQNAQPAHEHGAARPLSGAQHASLADRRSIYQRLVPANLIQQVKRRPSAMGKSPLQTPFLAPASLEMPPQTPGLKPDGSAPQSAHRPEHSQQQHFESVQLPHGLTADEFSRAFEIVASAAPALRPHAGAAQLHRASSHMREVSAPQHGKEEEAGGHGGHDAPNWSRTKSATVLLACTVLYAIIAEILVDVVDVVLDGFAIPEKLLGITLFALVPNTTEFMNAISFALNGNIALSMEIGSAYALQVCLIQIPAMLAFTAWYGIGKETMAHRAFTLVFPRWDAIAIIFSIFLLTYVYIEARSTYFRGSLLCFAYLTLLGGFVWAPSGRDTSDNPSLQPHTLVASAILPCTLTFAGKAKALFLSLFTH
ncbi:hypothetical protein NBRC10512_004175 [Rhodotorula toruloides]|uniref:RHTO0S12e00122g1_1 n=2 Tax=Rhodotorula toruloides TaxID=5286 RepID=A0A061B844_RHOTO|nr:Ca2+:H+ antiporter [Rhodotorula toruloides NP11]EMS23335.1 Ca2+:H+ antiporter [Rhodotorula toruloides NP11]CDR46087.1 RHTO0S12e00122g1_1 [Rhodotorula toruloides]